MTIGVPGMTSPFGIGAKGPIVARDKLLKVVESRDGESGKDVWCTRGGLRMVVALGSVFWRRVAGSLL
jgi:hypothetical protein